MAVQKMTERIGKESTMKRINTMSGMIALVGTLAGCADMTQTQQRALTGTVGGAAAGGIIGAIAGNAGMGAAVGAGLGGTGGFLLGQHNEAVNRAYEQGRASGSPSR
jgi:uncharacterized membrane protein